MRYEAARSRNIVHKVNGRINDLRIKRSSSKRSLTIFDSTPNMLSAITLNICQDKMMKNEMGQSLQNINYKRCVLTHRSEPCQADRCCLTFIAKSKLLNTSGITLKTGNNEKSSRLEHYTSIVIKLKIFGWVDGKAGNGGRNKNNCLPQRSHKLYPGPSGV